MNPNDPLIDELNAIRREQQRPVPPWSILTQPEKYVNAAHTDILQTFRKLGWRPPSEHRAPVLPIRKAKP